MNSDEQQTSERTTMTQNSKMPILCLDFDGVCHAYTSGWKGAAVIPDAAVPGLFEFLEQVAPYFDVQVFSSRSNQPGGIEAMQIWFLEQSKKWRESGGAQGFTEIVPISFPTEKPPAFISIDDRTLLFTGRWPSVEELKNFQPWFKKTTRPEAVPASAELERLRALIVDYATTSMPLEQFLALAVGEEHATEIIKAQRDLQEQWHERLV